MISRKVFRQTASHAREAVLENNPVPASPALEISGLCKRFGGQEVLCGIDLTVRSGDIVAVLGPSGCGKTTTLRLVAGFDVPDEGSIDIAGHRVAAPTASQQPERRRVGMVFQDGAVFPHMSVGDNVGFGLGRGAGKRKRILEVLDLVGLQGTADRMPNELSGGEQQRIALARALAPNPDLVLLDEPFASLDASLRVRLRADVRQILRNAHATAVLVTHDQEEALSMADRIAVMIQGRIVQEATPEELYHRPVSKEVGLFVGDAQFLPGEAHGRRVTCELGDLPSSNDADGPVDVMIRPEAIRLALEPDEAESNATVVSRLFYGHDQLLRIHLDSGSEVNARLGAYGGIRPGDRVHASGRGAVLALADRRDD